MNILITGCAGFIGFHLFSKFSKLDNVQVLGIDNINDYYTKDLKFDRLKVLGFEIDQIKEDQLIKSKLYKNILFIKTDINNREAIFNYFETGKFDIVYNLAAQAGVRYSITNPFAYIDSNISGFLNVLEACRKFPVKHLLFASSSSVYGLNTEVPFSTKHNTDHPISLYAATKKSNELMAHVYSHLYGIPCTGLRFFTVYGPWGRPDMALFMFTKNIIEGKPIDVFNNGKMKRDFTYIDDIIETLFRLMNIIPKRNEEEVLTPDSSSALYKIYNVGNNSPVELGDFINELEASLQKKAIINFLPIHPGDVELTYADVSDLFESVQFKPSTSIKMGIQNFVNWYKGYYHT